MKKSLFVLMVMVVSVIYSCNKQKKSKENTNHSVETEKLTTPDYDTSAFFEAALNGNLDEVNKAIKSGINVNLYNEDKQTALMLASFNGHHHIIKVLIENNASVDLYDAINRNALMYASTGPFAPAVKMLIKAGANVNVTDSNEHWTPLMMAAAEGQLDVVKLLVDNGAKLTMVDIDGESALDFAKTKGHAEVAQYIELQMK